MDVVAVAALIQKSLPQRWSVTCGDAGFYVTLFSPDGALVAQRSISITLLGKVQVYVHGHQLPEEHEVYKTGTIGELHATNATQFVVQVLNFVSQVRLMEVCVGAVNPQYKCWWKNSLEKCVIDNNPFHEIRYN